MTKHIVLRNPESVHRRQPLLVSQQSSKGGSTRFAEVAGGTTAECAAICCCFPCALANFLLLAIVKVPAGLCRKVLRHKRRLRLIKKRAAQRTPTTQRYRCYSDEDLDIIQVHPSSGQMINEMMEMESWPEDDKEAMEFEKEMWDMFYGTGFWRSPSQKSITFEP